jgi:seryl-tRNA synthetase
MKSVLEQIEEMRARLTQTNTNERTLVRSLGEALNRIDDELLHEVRMVTAQYNARRSAIMDELQNLAATIGTLPNYAHHPMPALEDSPVSRELPAYEPPPNDQQQRVLGRGDWRQATTNIQDELDFHLHGLPSRH